MHEYYRKNAPKFHKALKGFLKPVAAELELHTGRDFAAVSEEIWRHYEKNMLEYFPYIGGDSVSGDSRAASSRAKGCRGRPSAASQAKISQSLRASPASSIMERRACCRWADSFSIW